MTGPSDGNEGAARIAAWIDQSAAGLRDADGDRAAIVAAFETFIADGLKLVHSPSALWDHVATAIGRAGFAGAEWDRRMRVYSTVANQRFQGGRPYPPDWPWHETGGDAPAPRA